CQWTPNYTVTLSPQPYEAPGTPKSLILYNPTRMAQTYGPTATTTLSEALHRLADHPDVEGYLYPVEHEPDVAQAYAGWNADYNYCNPLAANDVVEAIRQQIISPTLEAYPSIQYVVLVGSDTQIPFYREWDLASIAHESDFTMQTSSYPSPLRAATAAGFYATDDAYGTAPGHELGWRGRYLWRPNLATGRLVENPDEIVGMIDHFISDPLLEAEDALVTGYDFLSDAAEMISATLAAALAPNPIATLIGEDWTEQELRAAWTEPVNAPDLVSVNAHFQHWRAQPADYNSDFFYNLDIVSATASLSGSVGWSMGCHAGYSVPDEDVSAPQTTPDFPQAMAQRQAAWIANTGYGYGMDDSVAGSERLMLFFTRALGKSSPTTIGEALREAKLHYLTSLPPGGLSVYDTKSIMEATLYGLPMYAVSVPNTVTLEESGNPVQAQMINAELIIENLYGQTWLLEPELQEHSSPSGSYYSVSGEASHAPVGRPLLPTAAYPLDDPSVPPPMRPHGALLLTATLSSHPNFDPIVARPVTDTALAEPPLNPALGWTPGRLFMVNGTGQEPHLAATFALLHAETRELRLLERSTVQIFYSPKNFDDYGPPHILEVDGTLSGDEVLISTRVKDLEDRVQSVYVTFITEDRMWSEPLQRSPSDASKQKWSATFTQEEIGWPDVGYLIQAVDKAGNVSMAAAKGGYRQIAQEITRVYLPLTLRQ
ncbi:MAG: hypothetical protein ACLFU8_08115, partial [Anaerolineales bacterium]